jgi:membrane protease YdiL (CAAX protease family)
VPVGLLAGFAAQVVLLLLLSAVYHLLGIDIDKVGQTAEDLTEGATDAVGVVLLVLIVGLAAPVFEELFYRGLWLRSVERRAGTAVAVVVSSLLFGLVHFEPYDLPALVGFAVVAAVLTVRTGRLGPAIWAHVAFNITAVVGLLAQ